MPLCTLHLLSLQTSTPQPLTTFLKALRTTDLTPLVISRVIRWIILPHTLSVDPLLAQNIHWDLLLVLPGTSPLPSDLKKLVAHEWTVTAGIPGRLLQDFHAKNDRMLHPKEGDVQQLTGALEKPKVNEESSQDLELSPELQNFIRGFSQSHGRGAVSMLNLLSFKPAMKPSYLKYGAAFAKDVGSKRGGNAKLVGTVVNVNGKDKVDGEKVASGNGEGLWDEIALAHYPSILHFADMLASADYQKANKEFRVPALRDTFILCTSEIAAEEVMGSKGLWSKL